MKKQSFRNLLFFITIGLLMACSSDIKVDHFIEKQPPITPDYTEVTIPPNIAPLRFKMPDCSGISDLRAVFEGGNISVKVPGRKKQISISSSDWEKLLKESVGSFISVRLQTKKDEEWTEYAPFNIYVAIEKTDPYIAYRLIEPGYEIWNEMGIYQRCLENYKETAILTNKMTNYGCMNCHSFCQQNPNKMLFHLRIDYSGTYVVEDGQVEKLDTASPLVYPSWHPSGDFVAFSMNTTKQMFHTTDKNRVEVMDYASNVVVYDLKRQQILTSPLLSSSKSFETFPTFSPDGKTLYFCSSDSVSMPDDYRNVKYSLCAIGYDSDTRSFGNQIDTLYNARKEGGSVSFPRVSPDGKWLMFTLSSYGNFSIWHKDADLYLADLETKFIQPLSVLNSNDVESYHSWSSNSRWVVFSSRRIDGLYTRPFITYIDTEGNVHKPFLLPQKDTDYYTSLMKSYNIPEFITGRVEAKSYTTGHSVWGLNRK
ncbi:MAG: hypothetical protein PHX50_11695 [Massilibacteroides sp.]|nr:hypothetical protein [Massilibacteroides sp.]